MTKKARTRKERITKKSLAAEIEDLKKDKLELEKIHALLQHEIANLENALDASNAEDEKLTQQSLATATARAAVERDLATEQNVSAALTNEVNRLMKLGDEQKEDLERKTTQLNALSTQTAIFAFLYVAHSHHLTLEQKIDHAFKVAVQLGVKADDAALLFDISRRLKTATGEVTDELCSEATTKLLPSGTVSEKPKVINLEHQG